MDTIDQLLAVKTRLTTIKGYAQLVSREIDRSPPRPERLVARIVELNREIVRLIELVALIEASMSNDAKAAASVVEDGDGYTSSGL